MAYDPEARETSNSAMIIGIVALVLVVGGALAYWATRPADSPVTQTIVVPGPAQKETVVTIPAAPAPGPPVIVNSAPPAAPPRTTTTVDRHTTVIHDLAPPAPADGRPQLSGSTNTNVTVNVPAPPAPQSPAGAGDTAANAADNSTANATGSTAKSKGY